MGGSTSKSGPKNTLPASHWALPLFSCTASAVDIQIISDALLLGTGSTGYFLYTPKNLESNQKAEFKHDQILSDSSEGITTSRNRTAPFCTAHCFELEKEDDVSIGKSVLKGSLKKKVAVDSTGDYSGSSSTSSTTPHKPLVLEGFGGNNNTGVANNSSGSTTLSPSTSSTSSTTTPGNNNNNNNYNNNTTNSINPNKVQSECLLLQFFRTERHNTTLPQNSQENYDRVYNYLSKDDFIGPHAQNYFPELQTKLKNVQGLAKLSHSELLNTQQILSLSLIPIPSETTTFPTIFSTIFQQLHSIPHIPYYLFVVDSTDVSAIERFFNHLQLIHLAFNSSPALKTVFENTTMHVLLLNNLDTDSSSVRNVNIQLWESDLKHYCSQLGLNNIKTHRLGSIQDIKQAGLLSLRRFLDTLLLQYFIHQYKPTTTPYLLDFAPTVAIGEAVDPFDDGKEGKSEKLPSSISVASFSHTSSLTLKNTLSGARSTAPTNTQSQQHFLPGQPTHNSTQSHPSSSWLSLKKSPYTIPFPSLHPSFCHKPSFSNLNGVQYQINELHTGRYPFMANLFTAHLYNNQQDCHLFRSKIDFLKAPTPVMFSAISHTIAVSSQPLNPNLHTISSQPTSKRDTQNYEGGRDTMGESDDCLGPLMNDAYGTPQSHERRLPTISPFSASNIQLPEQTYITSSRRLREIHAPSQAPSTMSKMTVMPKTPTKKQNVQFELFFSSDFEPHHEKLPAATAFRAPYLLKSIVPQNLLKSYEDEQAAIAAGSFGRGRGMSSYKKTNIDDSTNSLALVIERPRAGTTMNNNNNNIVNLNNNNNIIKDEVSELLLHSYQITPIYSNWTERAPLAAIFTCVPYLATFNVFFINLASLSVLKQSPRELWAGVKSAFGKALSNVHSIFVPTKVLFYTGDLLQTPLGEINELHAQQQQSSQQQSSQLTLAEIQQMISKQENIIMTKLKAKIDLLGSFQRQLWDFDRVDDQSLLYNLHQFEQGAVLRRLDLIYAYSLIQHPMTGSQQPSTMAPPTPHQTNSPSATSPHNTNNNNNNLRTTLTIPLEFTIDDQQVTPRNQSRSVY